MKKHMAQKNVHTTKGIHKMWEVTLNQMMLVAISDSRWRIKKHVYPNQNVIQIKLKSPI